MAQSVNFSFVSTFSNLATATAPTPTKATPNVAVQKPKELGSTVLNNDGTPKVTRNSKVQILRDFKTFSGSLVTATLQDPTKDFTKHFSKKSLSGGGSGIGNPVIDEKLTQSTLSGFPNGTTVDTFTHNSKADKEPLPVPLAANSVLKAFESVNYKKYLNVDEITEPGDIQATLQGNSNSDISVSSGLIENSNVGSAATWAPPAESPNNISETASYLNQLSNYIKDEKKNLSNITQQQSLEMAKLAEIEDGYDYDGAKKRLDELNQKTEQAKADEALEDKSEEERVKLTDDETAARTKLAELISNIDDISKKEETSKQKINQLESQLKRSYQGKFNNLDTVHNTYFKTVRDYNKNKVNLSAYSADYAPKAATSQYEEADVWRRMFNDKHDSWEGDDKESGFKKWMKSDNAEALFSLFKVNNYRNFDKKINRFDKGTRILRDKDDWSDIWGDEDHDGLAMEALMKGLGDITKAATGAVMDIVNGFVPRGGRSARNSKTALLDFLANKDGKWFPEGSYIDSISDAWQAQKIGLKSFLSHHANVIQLKSDDVEADPYFGIPVYPLLSDQNYERLKRSAVINNSETIHIEGKDISAILTSSHSQNRPTIRSNTPDVTSEGNDPEKRDKWYVRAAKGIDAGANWLKKNMSPDISPAANIVNIKIVKQGGIVFEGPLWKTDDIEYQFNRLQDKKLIDGDSNKDASILFKKLCQENPLISGYQFDLYINDKAEDKELEKLNKTVRWSGGHSEDRKIPYEISDSKTVPGDTKDLFTSAWQNYRASGLTIPSIGRNTSKVNYGYTAFSVISNSQSGFEHKAELTITCDKALDELVYLTQITGTSMKLDTDLFDLTTIADVSSKHRGNGGTAILQVRDGRALTEYLDFNEQGDLVDVIKPAQKQNDSGKSTGENTGIEWAYTVQFIFEKFKIINTDYEFVFDATSNNTLLNIKATVTWTRMQIVRVQNNISYDAKVAETPKLDKNTKKEALEPTPDLVFKVPSVNDVLQKMSKDLKVEADNQTKADSAVTFKPGQFEDSASLNVCLFRIPIR